jgi:hypothetical protein
METSIDLSTPTSYPAFASARRSARLHDPLLPIGVHEHHGPIFAHVPRKDLTKNGQIGAYEHSSVWISSRAFSDAVLYRGVEPL